MALSQPTPFTMHGVREVLQSSALHLEEQTKALEEAVDKNPGLAFDLARALLESVCKAVLEERSAEVDTNWNLPRLLKETMAQLRLVPDGLEEEEQVSASLKKAVGGLQTVVHGISELRNSHGFASHGKGPSFRQLDVVHASLVARSTDAIVNFLFRAHRECEADVVERKLSYGDNPEFDEYIDETNPVVTIFEMEYRPSEVLFQVDIQAYRNSLADWEAVKDPAQETGQEAAPAEDAP